MIKKILTISCLFLFSCEGGGSLTPGVGKTDKFASLIEKMNQDVAFTMNSLNQTTSDNKFVNFKITGIELIVQTVNSLGYISVPDLRIEESFDKTELLRVETETRNEAGDIISVRTEKYLFATKGKYYSEIGSIAPIEDLLIVGEIPLLPDPSRTVLIVICFTNNLILDEILDDQVIQQEGSLLSYQFQNLLFDFRVRGDDVVDGSINEAFGSGYISAERIAESPRF